jgi:hypothetical protein
MIVGRRSSPLSGIALALAVPVLFAAGIAVRLAIMPARGPAADMDQFVAWVHGIAVNGFGNAYDQGLSHPAVMAWIWGALAAVEPAFRTVTTAADPAISSLMKIPAIIADLAIAAAVGWWFRERSWAAVAAIGALLLCPVTWYVSAWWGQVPSLAVLPAVLALLAARARHATIAAAFLALSISASLGAAVLLVPFAAWILRAHGLRSSVLALVAGVVVTALAWAPFIAAGGPGHYLATIGAPGAASSGAASAGAWNPWWILDSAGATPAGATTIGAVVAVVFGLVVFGGVLRRPSPQGLALGFAAMSLVWALGTTGREPLAAWPAFVFLLAAANGRVLAIAWSAFAIAYAANLLWATPPPSIVLPAEPGIGLLGSALISLSGLVSLLWLARADEHRPYDDIGQPLHSLWPTAR